MLVRFSMSEPVRAEAIAPSGSAIKAILLATSAAGIIALSAQSASAETLTGTAGDDFLVGGTSSTRIQAGPGDDTLWGEPAAGVGRVLQISRILDEAVEGTLSPDGRLLAFRNPKGFFLKDLTTGTIAKITSDPGSGFAFSPDSNSIAISSLDSTLVPNDTNDARDVFVMNWRTGDIIRASTGPNGEQARGSLRYKCSR